MQKLLSLSLIFITICACSPLAAAGSVVYTLAVNFSQPTEAPSSDTPMTLQSAEADPYELPALAKNTPKMTIQEEQMFKEYNLVTVRSIVAL
jgi:hypothetical protein